MIDTAPAPVTLEPTTPIKPSEAIRLGCLIAPVQAFDDFTNGEGTACALGAMAYGWGWDGEFGGFEYDDPGPISRALAVQPMVDCPECGEKYAGWPPHLNDDHRWSRERIADWLEGIGR